MSKVLDYLKTYKFANEITMLLCLLTARRWQTIHRLDENHIQALDDKYIITVIQTVKQSKPRRHLEQWNYGNLLKIESFVLLHT